MVELPENQCRQHGSDYGWRGPSQLSIWKEVDRASQKVIAYHTHLSAYGAEQTIWMDGRPHPPDYAPHTWAGFSTGHWEGDILVVNTTHLKENWLGLNGVPRSDMATASAHIMRHGDWLTVAAITYDPVYLTEPLIRTADFLYSPQAQMAPWPCESVDEVDRPAGVVPNHLMGANPLSTNSGADITCSDRSYAGWSRDDVSRNIRKSWRRCRSRRPSEENARQSISSFVSRTDYHPFGRTSRQFSRLGSRSRPGAFLARVVLYLSRCEPPGACASLRHTACAPLQNTEPGSPWHESWSGRAARRWAFSIRRFPRPIRR